MWWRLAHMTTPAYTLICLRDLAHSHIGLTPRALGSQRSWAPIWCMNHDQTRCFLSHQQRLMAPAAHPHPPTGWKRRCPGRSLVTPRGSCQLVPGSVRAAWSPLGSASWGPGSAAQGVAALQRGSGRVYLHVLCKPGSTRPHPLRPGRELRSRLTSSVPHSEPRLVPLPPAEARTRGAEACLM